MMELMKSQGQTQAQPGLAEEQPIVVELLVPPLYAACLQDESFIEERLQGPQP